MIGAIHLRMVSPGSKPLDQMLDDVLEYSGVELVSNELSVTRTKYQVGITQHCEVPRDRSPARREFFGDLTRSSRSTAKHFENLSSGWISQRSENVIHTV
jgi:hypothetical protein